MEFIPKFQKRWGVCVRKRETESQNKCQKNIYIEYFMRAFRNVLSLWSRMISACLREHIPVRLHGKELLEVGTTKLRVEFTILVEPKDALLKVNREMVQVHEIHEKARRDEKPEEILGPVELSPQEADKPHVQQIFETPNKPSAKLNTPKLSSARRMTASTTTRRNAIPELNGLCFLPFNKPERKLKLGG